MLSTPLFLFSIVVVHALADSSRLQDVIGAGHITLVSSPLHSSPETSGSNETFYITALTNHPSPPYHARVQCWSLNATFTKYPTVGKSVSLGDADNVTYVVLPPRSAEGWHRPPHPMLFVLLSGLAQVYTPKINIHSLEVQKPPMINLNPDSELETKIQSPDRPRPDDPSWDSITVTPRSLQQVLVAADTDARSPGHLTYYPSDLETVALQIPFRDGKVPTHRVVHEGSCRGDE